MMELLNLQIFHYNYNYRCIIINLQSIPKNLLPDFQALTLSKTAFDLIS